MTSTPEKTVFIVDDDEGVRTSLSILLDSVGYIPVPFASACDFLAQYEGLPVCLQPAAGYRCDCVTVADNIKAIEILEL